MNYVEKLKEGCGKVVLQVGYNTAYCDGKILCKNCLGKLDGYQEAKEECEKKHKEFIKVLKEEINDLSPNTIFNVDIIINKIDTLSKKIFIQLEGGYEL